MSALVEINGLSKTYKKPNRLALDNLCLKVKAGSIYAFVGPNGAGKTTAIRIMTTLLSYERGSVLICGYDAVTQARDIRQMIGYIPDEFGFYVDMHVAEYLDFFGQCYGIFANQRPVLISDLLALVGLDHRRNDPIRSLSRGMRQRLGLARALINDPQLIIADEPAGSLDPRARFELREMFQLLRQMGKTIFLSSHILRELDDVATHMGIIDNGKMLVTGPVQDVRQSLQTQITVRLTLLGDIDNAHAWLSQQSEVMRVTRIEDNKIDKTTDGYPNLLLAIDGDESTVSNLLTSLIRKGFPVLSYSVVRDSLEHVFLELTEDKPI